MQPSSGQPKPQGRPPNAGLMQGSIEQKNLYLEQHELIAQIIGKTKSLGADAELRYRQKYLKEGQDHSAALSLNQMNDISKYAQQFLKSKMDTDMQMNLVNGVSMNNSSEYLLDGSREKDYEQSFQLLSDMIDRTLDDYKEELKQILFPIFIILFLTQVRRGFQASAKSFFDKNREIFKSNNEQLNHELIILQSVKTQNDLISSLEVDKYLKNKFSIKLSQPAKEILLQFLKFHNLILLMQVVNNNLEFQVTTQRNIIDMKSAQKLDMANGSILLPLDKIMNVEAEELSNLGRLPEFCPEATQINFEQAQAANAQPGPQVAPGSQPVADNVPKRTKKNQQTYNILTDPQIPLPQLDSILKEKLEKNLLAKVNLHKTLPTIGSISIMNSYRQLNCICLSDSGSVMATGMSDSTIKVFILSKKQHDVLTVDEMIRQQIKENLKNKDEPAPDEKPEEQDKKEQRSPSKQQKKNKPDKANEKDAGKQEKTEPVQQQMELDLDDEVDTETYELIGHQGPVFSVAISICDKHLLSGSYDNTIRRWSLQTKGPLMIYHGHAGPIWDLKFAPLGSYFVSCSSDRTAKLWILKNNSPLRIFASQGGHLNDVEAVEFHPNMHYVATGSSDRQVILWDVTTGNQARHFQTLPGAVRSLKFNRSGSYLYVGNDMGELVVFDLVQNVPIEVIQSKQSKAIWSIDISYDDAIVALGTESGTIELYNQGKIIKSAGKQLQELFNKDPEKQGIETQEEHPSFVKCYYTKSNQSGIQVVKFSWMNFLYTCGCVSTNLY